jgi:hypothetical protein
MKFKVPEATINFIVDKFHVGTSDDAIRADIRRRCAPRNGNPGATDSQLAKMEAYAVKRHHANQGLYSAVMTGRF